MEYPISEAVEQQAAMAAIVERAAASMVVRNRAVAGHIEITSDTPEALMADLRLAHRACTQGQTYYVGGDGLRLVVAGAQTLPGTTAMTADIMPSPAGFALLEWDEYLAIDQAMIDMRREMTTDASILGRRRALLWTTVTLREPQLGMDAGTGIYLLLAADAVGPQEVADRRVSPVMAASWRLGRTLDAQERWVRQNSHGDGDPRNAVGSKMLRLFASLCLFTAQRVVVAPAERADRGARRRLQAAGWQAEPLVRVVRLRAAETAARHASAGDGSDQATCAWSCRWIVRGHWRHYQNERFIQADGTMHRPVWVNPHTKGPDAKPLKVPRATVFAAVR